MLIPFFMTTTHNQEVNMAFPTDTRITVESIVDGNITLNIGPSSYQIQVGEIETLMAGTEDDIETLKRNVATALRLAGLTTLSDPIAVKQVIESRTFKAFR